MFTALSAASPLRVAVLARKHDDSPACQAPETDCGVGLRRVAWSSLDRNVANITELEPVIAADAASYCTCCWLLHPYSSRQAYQLCQHRQADGIHKHTEPQSTDVEIASGGFLLP